MAEKNLKINTDNSGVKKGLYLQTIKGKVVVMGLLGMAASVVLGNIGITALNKTSKNNAILEDS